MENARAGAGIFYGEGNPNNRAIKLLETISQSNQTGEVVAMKELLEKAPKRNEIFNKTDSQFVIKHLTSSVKKMENEGYVGVENRDLLRATVAQARERKAPVHLKWVEGHSGDPENEAADALAAAGAKKTRATSVNIKVEDTLRLTGAKLTALTQKLAYKTIRERKLAGLPSRRRTLENISRAKYYAEDAFKIQPSEKMIWTSLWKNKAIFKEERQFLWRTANDSYMNGNKWLTAKKPDMQARAMCVHDEGEESLKHIFTWCETEGQQTIWKCVEEIFNKRKIEWWPQSVGSIISCGVVKITTEEGKRRKGDERLYTTMIALSAKLIWDLRNERVIRARENKPYSTQEVQGRWKNAVKN
ncbi:ribonuclease H-like domain-containing protein [Flagelloscypha sp. PMI_526]|nr:ribonuclease H-like domain-containing protein [Flagelloscypha sp. PMI_526]